MEQEAMQVIASQGAWALLFVFMLFYVLKTNDRRELNYQKIIENLTDQFCIIEDVQKDVSDIKKMLK